MQCGECSVVIPRCPSCNVFDSIQYSTNDSSRNAYACPAGRVSYGGNTAARGIDPTVATVSCSCFVLQHTGAAPPSSRFVALNGGDSQRSAGLSYNSGNNTRGIGQESLVFMFPLVTENIALTTLTKDSRGIVPESRLFVFTS
mgnify:CR=1 FL=1